MKARVHVGLKPSVLDPQGKTIQQALHGMGHEAVVAVRQGKYFDIEFDGDDEAEARRQIAEIADKVLANPVIESYEVEILK